MAAVCTYHPEEGACGQGDVLLDGGQHAEDEADQDDEEAARQDTWLAPVAGSRGRLPWPAPVASPPLPPPHCPPAGEPGCKCGGGHRGQGTQAFLLGVTEILSLEGGDCSALGRPEGQWPVPGPTPRPRDADGAPEASAQRRSCVGRQHPQDQRPRYIPCLSFPDTSQSPWPLPRGTTDGRMDGHRRRRDGASPDPPGLGPAIRVSPRPAWEISPSLSVG